MYRGLQVLLGIVLVVLFGGIGILFYASTLSPPQQTYEQTIPVAGG
jgi:ABC-type polysaccharide/polyol phosphate export permease